MTKEEFFFRLARLDRRWVLIDDRYIRTADFSTATGTRDCPITAVYFDVFDGSVDLDNAEWAGGRIGLEKSLVEKILAASNIPGGNLDLESFELRVKLLINTVWRI